MAKVGSTKKKDATFVSGRLLITRGFLRTHRNSNLVADPGDLGTRPNYGAHMRDENIIKFERRKPKKERRSVSPVQRRVLIWLGAIAGLILV